MLLRASDIGGARINLESSRLRRGPGRSWQRGNCPAVTIPAWRTWQDYLVKRLELTRCLMCRRPLHRAGASSGHADPGPVQ